MIQMKSAKIALSDVKTRIGVAIRGLEDMKESLDGECRECDSRIKGLEQALRIVDDEIGLLDEMPVGRSIIRGIGGLFK